MVTNLYAGKFRENPECGSAQHIYFIKQCAQLVSEAEPELGQLNPSLNLHFSHPSSKTFDNKLNLY